MNKNYSSLRNEQTGLKGLKGHLLRGAALLILLCTALPAQTQDLYIIHNGNNYLSHNASSGAVNTTRVTAFDPTTCFWIISGNYLRPVNSNGEVLGNLYLRPRSGNNTYSLNTNTSTNYRDWNGLSNGGQPNYNYRYLRLNNTTWEVTNNNSNRGTLRLVDVSTVSTTSTNPTISGADALTATGSSSYNASGAVYQEGGYTDYYFNSAHHYLNGNTTITPATATISGYSWSISSDADVTASGTTATGTITVNTLPESDMPATITVTVTFTGGTPEVAANTTLTGTKEIIIQGTKPSAPTITVNGTSVTLATTAAGSTSIRYTLDGTEPTASTGNVYSGAIDLSGSATSPVTIKAVTVRNGNASDVSTEVVTLTLPTPVITANGSAGTATITCGIAGATIYYTTNGSTPTTSSTPYTTGLTGLAVMTTIKAIAVKDGWNNSAIASTTLTIPSGVSNGVVTLFDCEPHNWSYYSDNRLPQMMRSLNPADVKITYHGKGTKTVSTTDGATPAAASWTADATGVQVSYNEADSIFIYYKTLERTDGSTAASVDAATGRCAYTVIPNPFSKRPLYGSGTDKWRGFYKWRIKSITGGKIWTAATGGTEKTAYSSGNYNEANCLDADVIYYFEPTNEYGMEVELEALWARAYVVENRASYMNNNGYLNSNNLAADSYERNFYVCTGNYSSGTVSRSGQKPVTISTRYPDGTAAGTSSTINGDFTCQNSTKLEYITFNASGSTLNANGKDLVVGRGVTGTMGNLYGLSANGTTSFRFRIESGTYTNLYFLGQSQNFTNDAVLTATLGSDYDRAKVKGGDATYNEKLSVTDDIGLGMSSTAGNSSNKGAEIFHCTVKSGNYDLGTEKYAGSEQFYISVWGTNPRTYGKRTLIIEGGVFSDIAGGMEEGTSTQDVLMVDIRIKGGTVNSVVYGAAQRSGALGHRRMIITGGLIKGWIAGGANGTSNDANSTGEMVGNTYIYVGGNIEVNSNNSNSVLNRAVGGNVFGAGCGYGSNYSSGLVTGNTNVAIADNAIIERGVYGGGSYGYTTQTSNIYILGGTINGVDGGVNGTNYLNTIDGGVYGGACQNQGGTTNIIMSGGTVNGSVYGGSNYTGTLSGTSTVTLNGGTINGSLYGGGNGEGGTTNVTGAVHVTVNGGTVTGAVYGCGNVSGAPQSTVNVDVYGTDDHPGDGTYAIGAVFGGGNQANYTGTPNVTVHGNCTGTEKDISIGEVYGGGNLATVTYTNVAIYGGDTIGAVYAGAKGTLNSTTVMCTSATLNVYGGTIKRVFPGNNFGGYIGTNNTGTVTTTINANTVEGGSTHCPLQIGALFHGGNQASSNFRPVTITCTGAESEGIDTLFGGANQANITSAINLSVDNGNIRHAIFGGNNTSGTVQGEIVLDILKPTTSTASCYSAAKWPTVFGGGFGTATKVAGDVTVNIGKKTNDSDAAPTIAGDVYGGSAMGNVNREENNTSDTTAVNIFNGIVEGNVYGGGLGDKQSLGAGHINANAKVYGNVTVNIGDRTANTSTPTVQGYVFGCNNTNGSPQQNVAVHIYRTAHPTAATERGTYADMDAFNTFLNTAAAHATTSFALQAVYGGGNKADYTPATAGKGTSVYIHNCDNTVKMVYGGGRAADVGVSGGITANTSITVDGGRIDTLFSGGDGHTTSDGLPKSGSNTYLSANIYGNANAAVHGGYYTAVFGASNTSGTISGDRNMVIDKTSACVEEELIGTLFGGSNAADIEGDVELTIECGAGEFNEIYGGCNLADITGNVTLNLYGGTFNNVFGGSKGVAVGDPSLPAGKAANIDGDVTLNLYGGTMVNAFGGSNLNGNITGSITVNVLDWEVSSCELSIDSLYGSGNLTAYTPDDASAASPVINLMHICNNGNGVTGDVFGGGLGSSATVTANPHVNIGYNAGTMSSLIPDGYPNDASLTNFPTAKVGGNVFGGGEEAPVAGTTSVLLQHANSLVSHDIYGGGKLANVSGATTVTLNGGTVTQDVYGGGALANTGGATVTLAGAAVRDIYGGGLGRNATNELSAIAAQVTGAVAVTVNSGTVRDVFGCNYVNGAPTSTVTVNINNSVTRNVYGGGNLASYTGSPAVYINNGTVGGNVFGGGEGSTAVVTGVPSVTVGDLTVGHEAYVATVTGDVYGGGNAANVNTGTPVVLVQKCNTRVNNVYGGGNAANVPATHVTVTGGTINQVFGGGHGDKDSNPQKEANVTGSTSVTINGGTITQVFGGSNSKGSIGGTPSVTVNKSGSCSMVISEVYGGGNYAASTAGSISIGCTGASSSEYIDYVYGGANRADISGDIELTITGGRINHAFGGNNNSGTIDGDITVNVEWTTPACSDQYLGDVYGAGNLAPHTGNPAVNVKNGTATNVYGGGKGATAIVTGNPVVTIGDANGSHVAVVTGNVYGGGDAAAVTGNTSVTYNDNNGSSTVANLFGGGNAAGVSGNATVNMTLGKVTTGIYGGCNSSDTVKGLITLNLRGGQVGTSLKAADVYGGGLGANTRTTGSINVKLDGSTVYGNIYGGSALGQVNSTTVDILDGAVHQVNGDCGNVFGGGRGEAGDENVTKGQVNGTVVVNIGSTDGEEPPTYTGDATIEGMVFGCNNTNGSPKGDVYVNVYKMHHTTNINDFAALLRRDADTTEALKKVAALYENMTHADTLKADSLYALKAVYGGGNEADYNPTNLTTDTCHVIIHGCAENTIKFVYGGGRAASSNLTDVVIEGGHIYQAFAGGDGSSGTGANIGYRPNGSTEHGPGNTTITVTGGAVYQTFGGSNTLGLIRGTSTVNIDKTCEQMNLVEVFGGNNKAPFTGDKTFTITCGTEWNDVYGGANKAPITGNLTLNIVGGKMKRAFGGSKAAPIDGDVTVNVTGGSIENLFGGNNVSGNITGKITVNVACDPGNTCEDARYLGNVYGGGKDASYTPSKSGAIGANHSPVVNIKCGTVSGDVFGGGLGSTATSTSKPQVVIGLTTGLVNDAVVNGNVYGGGSAAGVTGNTSVLMQSGTVMGDIFGGGLGTTATVSTDTEVGIVGNRTQVQGNVYGGGNAGAVGGSTEVYIGEKPE